MKHFIKYALATLLGVSSISCDREDEKIEEKKTEIITKNYKLKILGENNYELESWYSAESVVDMRSDENLQKVKKIGDYAFFEKRIRNIILPDSLEVIGVGAFQFCKLKSVVIPDNVSVIEKYAFDTNDGLEEVVLSQNLKSIGERAFAQNRISQLTIPSKVEYIGDTAFGDNFDYTLQLTTVIMEGTVPPRISGHPFTKKLTYQTPFTIYVPKEALNAYKSSWSIYSGQIVSKN